MGVYHIARMLYLLGLPQVLRISGKVYQETDMDEGRRRRLAKLGFQPSEAAELAELHTRNFM